MGAAVRQSALGEVSAGTVAQANFGSATLAGSTIVIGVTQNDGVTNTITDSAGNTYTAILSPSPELPGAGDAALYLYECANVAAGVTWVKVTTSATSYPVIIGAELTGVKTASPRDTAAQRQGGVVAASTSPFVLTTGTLAQANNIVLAFGGTGAPGGTTAGLSSPWTTLQQEQNNALYWGQLLASQYVTSTAAVTASWNLSPFPITLAAATVVYQEASAGGASISPSGIASAEAFGVPSVGATAAPTGIASAQAFGTPSVGAGLTATGIASAEAFGAPVVQPTALVSPTGIASAEAFGIPAVGLTLAPTGIASAQALGVPSAGATVGLTGIASAEAFGTPTVVAGGAVVAPVGVASAEAFGVPVLGLSLMPQGVGSAEAFGTPQAAVALSPSGIVTGEAWGVPAVLPSTGVVAVGIASAAAFGVPVIGLQLGAVGIAGAEAFGRPVLGLALQATGITGAEAFGAPVVGDRPILIPSYWIYTMLQAEGRATVLSAERRVYTIPGEHRTHRTPYRE